MAGPLGAAPSACWRWPICWPANPLPLPESRIVPRKPFAVRAPHHPARAKRVIFLYMPGGPSHVDLFDPKPRLLQDNGSRSPSRSQN